MALGAATSQVMKTILVKWHTDFHPAHNNNNKKKKKKKNKTGDALRV